MNEEHDLEQIRLTRELFSKVQDIQNSQHMGLMARITLAANLYATLITSIEKDLGEERAAYYMVKFVEITQLARADFLKQLERNGGPAIMVTDSQGKENL